MAANALEQGEVRPAAARPCYWIASRSEKIVALKAQLRIPTLAVDKLCNPGSQHSSTKIPDFPVSVRETGKGHRKPGHSSPSYFSPFSLLWPHVIIAVLWKPQTHYFPRAFALSVSCTWRSFCRATSPLRELFPSAWHEIVLSNLPPPYLLFLYFSYHHLTN